MATRITSGVEDEAQTHDAHAQGTNPSYGVIFAAGFNAHSQLRSDSTVDVRTFTKISGGESIQNGTVLFAGWSSTVHTTTGTVTGIGNAQFSHAIDPDPETGMPIKLHSAIGDHNGIKACLDETGDLYVQVEPGEGLVHVTSESSPSLSRIAGAQNGRIAITFKQALNGRLCHINEFADFGKFVAWYQNPSGEGNYPSRHYMLPGRPKQMVANMASFMVLMEDGRVYSWGDPRLRSLGRTIVGEGASPAGEPGLVAALDGLKIVKVASGGWLSAALSEDGALYIWGAAAPGSEQSIKCLCEAEAGEVVLVELMATGPEPLDVLDMAVGEHHIAAVSASGNLFVVGDNRNGQLGLGSSQIFFEDWTNVPLLSNVSFAFCGPKSTFACT